MPQPNSERPARFGAIVALLGALALAGPALAGDPPRPPAVPARVARVEDFAPPEEFVVAGGIKTHYIAKGDPKGRPIVLVHGFGSCTYTWRFNVDALAARGFRVYAVDIKGFGLTEKPRDGKYSLAAFTRHLVDFLDALGIERPILVGNSMGGSIIARVALAHPDRVAGVVLVDAAPPISSRGTAVDGPKDKAKDADVRPPSYPGIRSKLVASMARAMITRQAVESGLKAAYRDPKFVTAEAIEVYYRPITIEGATEALMSLSQTPIGPPESVPPLRSLKVPALIVWGRHDRVIPVSMADYFARELPAARKVILENSGHMPHEEEADAFNALLVEFAASAPATPKSASPSP